MPCYFGPDLSKFHTAQFNFFTSFEFLVATVLWNDDTDSREKSKENSFLTKNCCINFSQPLVFGPAFDRFIIIDVSRDLEKRLQKFPKKKQKNLKMKTEA